MEEKLKFPENTSIAEGDGNNYTIEILKNRDF